MKKERLQQILIIILENNDFISANQIAKILHVSVRTIYNDLESLEFKQLLQGAKLNKKQNQGIKLCATKAQKDKIYMSLEIEKSSQLNDQQYNDIYQVLLRLLMNTAPLYVEHLSSSLYKSKSSITQILNSVEEYIHPFHCHIDRRPNYGITIHGNECDLRNLFITIIKKAMEETINPILYLKNIFGNDFINEMISILHISEKQLNTHYTDYDFQILLIKICILVKRIQQDRQILSSSFDTTLQEYYVAAIIKMKLEESFHIHVSHSEHAQIAESILSTRKTNNSIYASAVFDEQVVDKFISKISTHLDINLSTNEELKINLINHLKPAIRRIKYGSPSENPMLNHIRYKFTYVYIAVMITIDEIEQQEHIFFDANELSFICLHIVAAINRNNSNKTIRALLISNDGLTINTYIKSCIEKFFSEISIKKIMNSDTIANTDFQQYDVIFNATQHTLNLNHPIVSINPILEDSDYAKIRHWLYYQELENAMTMKSQLKDYILMFHDDTISKYDILKKYCGYLVETGYVKSCFYESVLERENRSSTSIGRGVAVPHGSPELVIKPVILIIHTKHAIPWDELNVDMIFLTAIDNKHSSNYNYFFKQLFHIVENEEKLNQLKKSKSQCDIEKILFEKA